MNKNLVVSIKISMILTYTAYLKCKIRRFARLRQVSEEVESTVLGRRQVDDRFDRVEGLCVGVQIGWAPRYAMPRA